VEHFKSVASLCAVAVRAPNTDLAWVEWLEALRRDAVDFKAGDMSLRSRAQEPRPL